MKNPLKRLAKLKKHTWSLSPQEAKVYLQNILENINDSIYFKDRKSRFLLVNDSCMHKHGFKDMEDTIGKTDADVFTEDHAQQALKDEERIIATGEPLVGLEEKETWPDGSATWVSTTKVPMRDPEGNVIGTFGISRDITDKKEAEFRAAEYAAENQRLQEEMEEDVRVAGELQKAFFPKSYPAFPQDAGDGAGTIEFGHYAEPCGYVGGDLCSIKRISPTEAGVFLCDVMGHGVRAALGTAIVRSLIEELSPIENDPGQFMTHLNQRICPIFQNSKDVMFITALYLIIDTESGLLRFCSAGHPRPIRYSSKCHLSATIHDPHRAPALALFEDMEYLTVQQDLDPRDVILLYSDGIFETSNPDNEQYGKTRLAEFVTEYARQPVSLQLQAILSDLQNFSTKPKFEDDICLVGFKWTGPETN
ncbi:MAG: SpoIIE family protein phosphatase [Puniceicoccaceae bacterium]